MDVTVDQIELRTDVREATKGVSEVLDRAEFMRRARAGEGTEDVWKTMAELGLLGIGVPEEYGGSGIGMTGPVAVMESLSEAGTPPVMYLITAFARMAIIRHGTEDQKRRFVEPSTTGEVRLCFAITESDAGTNSFELKTFAREDGDNYVLNGEKVFISAAADATHAVVVARTTRFADVADKRNGLSIFVVALDSPGIDLQEMRINLHSPEKQYVLSLSDVSVSKDDLVGARDEGHRALFDALNPERLLVSAWAVGMGNHVLDRAVEYVRNRAPFGKPIGSYQAVQHPLARAKAHLDAAQLMMYTACEEFDSGGDAGAYANTAKFLASEAANEAIDAVIQSFGGSAFDEDSDITPMWPMIRLLRIAPVNNEMVLNFIAERLLRLPKSY